MDWRQSSYSSSKECVEASGAWVKSSLSFSNGGCCEVARCSCGHRGVLVRDTKDRSGPVLAFPASTWRAFLAATKDDR